jgi:hypothetical protein
MIRAANSSSPVRHVDQYGVGGNVHRNHSSINIRTQPVPDFTTKDVTCGPGGNVPTSALAPVKAGQTVMFDCESLTPAFKYNLFIVVFRGLLVFVALRVSRYSVCCDANDLPDAAL